MRRRARQPQESDNQDRWLVSYADFITLLFAFFVVMYAISSVNEGKYRVLTDSLTSAFKTTPKSMEPVQIGQHATVSPQTSTQAVIRTPQAGDASLLRLQELARNKVMSQISKQVNETLKPLIDKGVVNVKQDSLWVEIDIKSNILFGSGEAIIQQQAVPALSRLAKVLGQFPNDIQVEGYTDNVPISTGVFPSNWELSAARAANVVHLFMNHGVTPERMAAVGFGEYRPIADNHTEPGRNKNRRVAIIILADSSARRVLDNARDRLQQSLNLPAQTANQR